MALQGNRLFGFLISAIIIFVCLIIFLNYSDRLSVQAEATARKHVENEIRQALAMTLYQHAIKGRQAQLQLLHRGNPFKQLELYRSLSGNYHGEIDNVEDPGQNGGLKPGWYYVTGDQTVVYRASDNTIYRYVLQFRQDEGVGYLEMQELPDGCSISKLNLITYKEPLAHLVSH